MGMAAGSPEVWVSSWRTVTFSRPRPVKDGSQREMGSSSRIFPSSTSTITAVVVATALVSEAKS
jgi:hypothetical protein